MGLTQDIAAWVARTSLDEMPPEVRRAAQAACLDTIGVILAGAPEPVTRLVAEVLAEEGARPAASQLGGPLRTSVEGAALLNGISGHALDYDDVSRSAHGHPSVVVLPAVLALAEARCASGRALLEAYVVGVEVMATLGQVAGAHHYRLGWHATSTLGTLGAAAAAGKLLGLDAAGVAHALALAASESSGSRRNFGTMAKPFHAGHAARCGVHAARLAQRGVTGETAVLEAPLGFFALFAPGASVPGDLAEALGRPYELASPGLSVKLYPCCYATHRAVEGVMELRGAHALPAEEVTEVVVRVPPGVLAPLISWRPRTGLEGKFSMEYAVAAALWDGRLTLATFTDDAVARPEVGELMDRITVVEDAAIPVEANVIEGGYVEVRIRTRDGTELTARVERARGAPERPLGPSELAGKFRDCAARVLGGPQIDRAMALIRSLEDVPDVAGLVAHLVPGT
jgi:2-methylcitrate dehydratase PrpD